MPSLKVQPVVAALPSQSPCTTWSTCPARCRWVAANPEQSLGHLGYVGSSQKLAHVGNHWNIYITTYIIIYIYTLRYHQPSYSPVISKNWSLFGPRFSVPGCPIQASEIAKASKLGDDWPHPVLLGQPNITRENWPLQSKHHTKNWYKGSIQDPGHGLGIVHVLTGG